MFNIPLLIDLFISLIEHPLKASNKRTHIPLFINVFISLIQLEYPLETSNKKTQV